MALRLAPPQFFRQLVAPLAAVLLIFCLIGRFGLLQQLLRFLLELLLLLHHPAVAYRLVLALAFNFVPSSDIRPSWIDPHSSAIAKTCSNRFCSVAMSIWRKSEMVRTSGSFPATNTFEPDVFLQRLLDLVRGIVRAALLWNVRPYRPFYNLFT